MATRRVKVQDGENLTDANKDKVISLLESDNPITKKVACEILNITYNTTRLNRIIQERKDDIIFRKEMRKKMRNTPIKSTDASQIVSGYLSGSSLADLSAETYRSTNVVKNVLTKYNIPIRNASVNYFHPTLIDNDEAIKDDYVEGDLVYSARYDKPATVRTGHMTDNHGMVYSLWLHGVHRKQIAQPYYELADLRKLQTELNITMEDLTGGKDGEVTRLMYEAMKNQKKQEDKRIKK
jgi:hypothetical protein